MVIHSRILPDHIPGKNQRGDADEEDAIQDRIGAVVPGVPLHRRLVDGQIRLDELIPISTDACDCAMSDLPPGWALEFPASTAMTAEAVRRFGNPHLDADTWLMRRFECEYRIFRTVEESHVLPTLAGAFSQVDDFVSSAMSVINRRKNRAGRALELHLATVFQEEGVSFQAQVMTETGSKVDFLFPSLDRYQGATSAASDIHMLAVKTTLKDRWRQVLQEGKKVSPKHLFTLDEGVSLATYQDMKSRDLQLVVPQRKVAHFPEPVRQDILTLRTFIELVKGAAA